MPDPLGAEAATARAWMRGWLREFLPGRMAVNARERWRVALGAALGLLCAGLACHALVPPGSLWLAAPVGASAVLVFGLPASPLAQPWAVVGGNTLSALMGVACVAALGTGPWVTPIALALAIAVMFALRCLHPPGGAAALLPVLGGIHDPAFALFPVLANCLLLVAAGVAWNSLTGRRYPHGAFGRARSGGGPQPVFTEADLDAVLARYNQVLDVPRDDLQLLLAEAEQRAYARRLGALRCQDVMSTDLALAEYGTPLQQAWAMLRDRQVKSLPVVDRARRVIGIVTLADFMRGAELDLHHGWVRRLRDSLRPSPHVHTDKPEVVGQIMARQVRVASAERPISELVPLFAATGHHHIPVIDREQRLVGILTQSDVVAALTRA